MGICFTANAQPELTKTVVASSGGNFTNGTLTLSSTVAEMTMVTTLSVSGNDLFQGFQNNAWIIQDVAVRPVANTDLTVVLYPNPATTFLNLEVVGRNTGKMIISIVDMLGHTLQLISVPELQSKMQLDVSKLPSGIYALAVLDQSNQGVFNQTFKIIH